MGGEGKKGKVTGGMSSWALSCPGPFLHSLSLLSDRHDVNFDLPCFPCRYGLNSLALKK
jgi:hypothetical protein